MGNFPKWNYLFIFYLLILLLHLYFSAKLALFFVSCKLFAL